MNSCNILIEIPPAVALQPEFEPLVMEARAVLRAGLGELLDSLYLYGSVSRGYAQPGQSDLDLTLVLARPLFPQERESLECMRLQLQERYPVASKVDFDLGLRDEVLHPDNVNSWGYWLKHECRCIDGTDLALQFSAFRPSAAIARAINEGYSQALADYAHRISAANSHEEMRRLQKEAARKLVRATNVLRPESDSYWPRTLEDHAAYFSGRYPDMAAPMAFFLKQARAPDAQATVFIEKLAWFTQWMLRQPAPRIAEGSVRARLGLSR